MSPQTRSCLRPLVTSLSAALVMVALNGCARKARSTTSNSGPLPVFALAFSPDGKGVATSIGSKATLWDTETGKEVVSLEAPNSDVRCLAFSPDGKTIAGGVGKSINLWDPATGKVQKTLEGHSADPSGVGFSPDGKTLVSVASKDLFSTKILELWLWNVGSGKKIGLIETKQSVINCFAMAPDRQTFATGGRDASVQVWNLTQKAKQGEVHLEAAIYCAAISADGKYVAISDAAPNLTLAEAGSGKELGKVPGLDDTVVNSMAFSPDGKHLAAALDDKTVQIWEVPSLKLVTSLKGHSRAVRVVAYSPDGKTLASGGGDGEVRLWNVDSGETRTTLK